MNENNVSTAPKKDFNQIIQTKKLTNLVGYIPQTLRERLQDSENLEDICHYIESTGKKPIIAFLLGIVCPFMYLCGIHNFYLGRPAKAICQMLTGWIFVGYVWHIIDVIGINKNIQSENRKLLLELLDAK